MSASDLLIWGIVIHLVIDWLAQNEWMAVNKATRRERFQPRDFTLTVSPGEVSARELPSRWWDRHPAAYVHAGLHGAAQLFVFPWPAALAIGITHMLIDTRKPVESWSKLIRQTQPLGGAVKVLEARGHDVPKPYFDIGAEVRIWADQVWHIAVIALAALVVSA